MTRHCESCGQLNPSTDEGYTTCCNEPVCYGETPLEPIAVRLSDGSVRGIRACCWGTIRREIDGLRVEGGHASCNSPACPVHGRR